MNKRVVLKGVAVIAGLVLCPSNALANTVSYQCGAAPAFVIVDGGVGDSDGVVNNVVVTNVSCTVTAGGHTWSASGKLSAQVNPAGLNARVRLSSFVIENLVGNLTMDIFRIRHFFPAFPAVPVTSRTALNGHFDNVIAPGFLNGGQLAYGANVVGFGGSLVVGGGATPLVAGAAPIPFSFAGGPVTNLQLQEQNGFLNFYLDSPGDAIILSGANDFSITSQP